MAEVKTYNGQVAALPQQQVGLDTAHPARIHALINKDFLCSLAKSQQFYAAAGLNDAETVPEQAYTANFKPVFYPESILPRVRGTSASQVVGDNYKWLNTMVDIVFNPSRFLEIYKCTAAVLHNSYKVAATQDEATIKTLSTGTPGQPNKVAVLASRQQLPLNIYSITNLNNPPGQDKTSYFSSNTTTTYPYIQYRSTTDEAAGALIPHTDVGIYPDNNILKVNQLAEATIQVGDQDHNLPQGRLNNPKSQNLTYFPLMQVPTFRPFFYMRLVVFKLKMSQTDYVSFRKDVTQQCNFLNCIWWNRFDANNVPHQSVRTNDLNVDNPFGGMFQFKYNRLIQVNPFKTYKFRINLYSTNTRGDLITLKDNNPFVQADATYPYYSNGLYVCYLLPPLNIGLDFDSISSQIVASSNIYNSDGTGTRNPDINYDDNSKLFSPPYSSISISNVGGNPLDTASIGQSLLLGQVSMTSRTRYLD